MSWLNDMIDAHGNLAVCVDGLFTHSQFNEGTKAMVWSYVWFIDGKNHNIRIEEAEAWDNFETRTRVKTWSLIIRSHVPAKATIELHTRTKPDDALMRSLLAIAGFLPAAAEVSS